MDRKVIYCNKCGMWFDTKNGNYLTCTGNGLPLCPNCYSIMIVIIDYSRFYQEIKKRDNLKEIMTWEWPNGLFWKGNDK